MKKITFIIISILFAAIILYYIAIFSSRNLSSSLKMYPADAKSTGRVVLKKSIFKTGEKFIISRESRKIVAILDHQIGFLKDIVYFKTTQKEGLATFQTNYGLKIDLTFYKIRVDLDADGFPDDAELNSESDRRAFIKWFVRIAEAQYLKKNYSWNRSERDCAGLIRYAFREALKKHDRQWFFESGVGLDKNLPDIKKYSYPDIPFLKDKIFKIKEAKHSNINSFGYFADVRTLINLNTRLISRNLSDAKPGDLLFFEDKSNIKYPYHSMIIAGQKNQQIVIYHTGSGDVVKRVPVTYLKKSKKFNPVAWNNNFLGVFRFLILE